MTTILLLRHGETALNVVGAFRGHIDVGLSEHGKSEARALGTRVAANYQLQAIYASPLQRARQTAHEVASHAALDVQIDDRFLDIDYGTPWTGRAIADLTPAEHARYREWVRNPSKPLPGAEDPRVAQARARAGLEALAKEGRDIAIVSHDAILQLLFCGVFGLELATYRGLVQHTATLNEIVYADGRFRVRLLNSTWHLDQG